jgi:oxygen-independent coproporphyrinogen-3 oxidase
VERYEERVLLEIRLADGLPLAELAAPEREGLPALVAEGLLDADTLKTGTLTLTLRGRLLADHIVRRLLP